MKFPALMPPKPEPVMTSTTGYHTNSYSIAPQKKRKPFFRTVYNSLAYEIDRPSVFGLTLVLFLVITSPVWVPPHLTYKIFNIIRDALAD